MGLLLCLLWWLVGCASPHAHILSWETNAEATMHEYRVYTMPDATVLAVVAHDPSIPRQEVVVESPAPCYAVTAVDIYEQESGLSEQACLHPSTLTQKKDID